MNNKINVLLLGHTFADPGGTQKYIYELGKLLSEKFNVYECSFDAYNEPRIFNNGNILLSLDVRSSNKIILKFLNYFIKAYRLNRIKKLYNIDLTISNLWPADFINFLSLGRGKIASNGLVNIIGNDQNKPLRKYKKIIGWIYRKFDMTIAINDDLKEELEDLFCLSSNKVKCIYAFITINDISKLLPIYNNTRRRIVWFGRLNHMKNLSPLFKILKIVKEAIPGTQLIIIGDGPHRKELIDSSKSYGLAVAHDVAMPSSDVIFLGFVTNPYEYLVGCNLFALTSKSEGFGLVLVEAMAAGLPILASDCPTGGPHLIMQGRNGYKANRVLAEETPHGYLMPIPDESKDETCLLWAEKIQELISDGNKSQLMADANRIRSTDFSTDKIRKQWFGVINELTIISPP
jgi:glycosyltransferase involved in cell wall biosynthesis